MDLQKLKDQLLRHEGLKLKPYVDSVGKITIGIGHNLTDKGLTLTQVNAIFLDDVNDTLAFISKHFPWWNVLNDTRQRAIFDLVFNMGGEILTFKKMLAAIEVGDWTTAAAELLNSHYATQVGKRAHDVAAMLWTGRD